MPIPLFFQLAAAAALTVPTAGPDTIRVAGPANEGASYNGAAADIEVATPRLLDAAIDIDGRIDDAAWSRAATLDGFTQFKPVEGSEASQRTEVLVFVDDDAIYFAVKAFDSEPDKIRATLSERDAYTFSDDYVRFILDTFDDQRRAYVFTINPLGVQHDGLWNETGGGSGRRGRGNFGSPIDENPDFLWDSDAHITETGYEAEIRIPFKSLRFPELAEQSWGLQIERKIQRNGYESSWAPITGNVANKLALAGKLTGLQQLDMGLFMELNPVLTGARNGAIDDFDNFTHSDPSGEFSLNTTYGVTSDLTLDATYNPDFSQVEADAGQVQVNERFSLFFAEKRPFFLEGTEIFGMPKQLIYTRTIQNPIAGGKLTGKVAGLSVGYLGAVDETFVEDASDVYVNLLRVRGDLGASSTIGAVYTDRTRAASDFNRVAGADARLQFAGRYTVTLMGARSYTNDDDMAERLDGGMKSARIERAGRTFSFNVDFEDTEADFNPGSGYFQRLGTAQVTSRTSYTWFGQRGALIEEVAPSFEMKGYWDHDRFWDGEGLDEGEVQVGARIGFKDNITFFGNVKRTMFDFRAEQYDALYVRQLDDTYEPFRPDQALFDGLMGATAGVWINKWERVRGNVMMTWADTPIFDRSYGVAVEPARSTFLNASMNLYPMRALQAQIGLTYSTLIRERDDQEHSSALIPRIRAQYQFSRALFLRGIFEYGSQESIDLGDPDSGLPLYACDDTECSARTGSAGHDFRMEGLIGYEPSPGTVFFLGYTREMEDSRAFGFENVRPTRDGLFLKLSYRFRL